MELHAQEEITQLITKYLSGNAENEEIELLKHWIEGSPDNKEYFLQLRNIWDISNKKNALSSISTEKAMKKVFKKVSVTDSKFKLCEYWQKIAAVLILPVLVGGILWIQNQDADTPNKVTYNEVFTAIGTRSSVKLADGSVVWLNSGSSLKYPDKFTGKQRVVELKGEGYFEVESDKTRPFIVKTESLSVKATGTKFNVSAFKNNHLTEVTLVSGKVAVEENNNSEPANLLGELKPNQHLSFNKSSSELKLKEEDVYKYIAWKDGKMVFRNELLKDVVKKISQQYNVEIELQGESLQNYHYRATFEEESLSEILKLLKLSSPIDYKETRRTPLPDGTFPKRKIVIFPRKAN